MRGFVTTENLTRSPQRSQPIASLKVDLKPQCVRRAAKPPFRVLGFDGREGTFGVFIVRVIGVEVVSVGCERSEYRLR